MSSSSSTSSSEDVKNFFKQNHRMAVGAASSQGKRNYMQDILSVVLSNNVDSSTDYIAVCDGHGRDGDKVAKYVARTLCGVALRQLVATDWKDYEETLVDAFLSVDSDLHDVMRESMLKGGTTCASVWLHRSNLFSAHVGDSQTILSVDKQAVAVTEDHTPTLDGERERIENAGGFVKRNRTNGVLAVSRSFGNHEFKNDHDLDAREQIVSCVPDVMKVPVRRNVDFMVMCSDGVNGPLKRQEIVNYINEKMEEENAIKDIAKELLEDINAIDSSTPTFDNCVIVIATFKDNFFRRHR